ncbi:Histone H3-K79 methyltransferase [Gammaproteobacteria bacterium]
MNQKDIIHFLYSLYGDISPATISISCRKKHGIYDNLSLVYGESHLPSLYELFNEINPRSGEIFYDLGSGSGRLVLYAALSFPFAKCIGIELLDDLINVAQIKLELCKKELPDLSGFDANKLGEIDFIQADFIRVDLSTANVVYIASTCFNDEFMYNLALHLEKQLVIGTRIITFSRPLLAKKIKITKSKIYPMEWGKVTIFFHEKI